jgi:hypothetical protein
MHVFITAATPGTVFGLAHSQMGWPPNVVKHAIRMFRLRINVIAAQWVR